MRITPNTLEELRKKVPKKHREQMDIYIDEIGCSKSQIDSRKKKGEDVKELNRFLRDTKASFKEWMVEIGKGNLIG